MPKTPTKASLNCQKVGLVRSLREEGRTARRVQAKLGKQNQKSTTLISRQYNQQHIIL